MTNRMAISLPADPPYDKQRRIKDGKKDDNIKRAGSSNFLNDSSPWTGPSRTQETQEGVEKRKRRMMKWIGDDPRGMAKENKA